MTRGVYTILFFPRGKIFALARPGTFLRVGFFTAAVWCVPALRVPLVHSLINHFRQKRCVRFATVERDIREKLAEHRAWTDRLRYTPGVRYFHVAYEQLTGAAAENYLRSVVAFVLDN